MSKVSTNMGSLELVSHMQFEIEYCAVEKAIMATIQHCGALERDGISLESKSYNDLSEEILRSLGYD